MFNGREFYREENLPYIDKYREDLVKISDIVSETEGCTCCKDKVEWAKFFNHTGKWILKMASLEEKLNKEYFTAKSFEELREENAELYREIQPEHYERSYANPCYAVKVFGNEIGALLSAVYVKYREYIGLSFKHKIYRMAEYNGLFVDMFSAIRGKAVDYNALKALLVELETKNVKRDYIVKLKEGYCGDFSFYSEVFSTGDLTDLRYLFSFGEPISDNEIKTARFLNSYDEEKLSILAESIAAAYESGFIRDNKDMSKRSVVRLIYSLGQERLLKFIDLALQKRKLNSFVCMVESTEVNKQYSYDHRFDNALYLDEAYAKLVEVSYKAAAESSKHFLKDYSGILLVEKFGEAPYSPLSKKECLKLSETQNALHMKIRSMSRQLIESYTPETETSFCIVAFPSPEIGEHFEEIFADICRINMLDSKHYEAIQQSIIDALDLGDYVHVKGCGNNKTDIKVKLHELKNPAGETNFENCVADVNIPVGEVFTSPVLKGTNGVLHIEETYLGLKYKNLMLKFEDGFISDYSCTNFDSEEENKKYIEENLIFPHKTLPLGEFAIGTNTLAYVIARKYDIVEKLPVLIIEKMGPHFAIGDTCFSFAEDTPVYNPTDKKEIIARDNEKSILRKTDINKAYTNVHTDITLPYDGLEFITVVTKTGEKLDLIRDGRFVLAGTEELNKPFEE